MSVDRPIRVMHVLPWVTSGGVERRRMQLAQRLDPVRFRQRVVCLYAKYDFVEAIREAGVEVVCFDEGDGSIFDLQTIARLISEIRRFAPDIIHGAVFEGVTMAALAGTLAGVRHVVVEETGDPSIRSWRGDALMGLLTRLADVSVGVSPAITHYLEDRLHLGDDRVRLIHNGVDPPRTPTPEEVAAARAEFGLTEDDFVIGSVGRIDNDHKRFTDLIDAVALLDDEEARLLIVGSGQDIPMLQKHAAAAGIGDRVIFTGYQADVGLMYALMDLFALASRQESFGLVLVEAMFAGLPIVATNVGGIPSIVVEGETGFMVPPFEPRTLSRALHELSVDNELRLRMGEAGRLRAREHFTAEPYVRDVEALYAQLA